jgi:hypothetical protein
MDSIQQTEDTIQYQAIINTVKNLEIAQKSLTS